MGEAFDLDGMGITKEEIDEMKTRFPEKWKAAYEACVTVDMTVSPKPVEWQMTFEFQKEQALTRFLQSCGCPINDLGQWYDEDEESELEDY